MIDLNNFGLVSTFFLAVGALWVALSRFSVSVDNTWPLVFYAGLVVWGNVHDGVLNPLVLYSGVVCGLMLRFEFLNERLIMVVRLLELALLMLVAWDLFGLLVKNI